MMVFGLGLVAENSKDNTAIRAPAERTCLNPDLKDANLEGALSQTSQIPERTDSRTEDPLAFVDPLFYSCIYFTHF